MVPVPLISVTKLVVIGLAGYELMVNLVVRLIPITVIAGIFLLIVQRMFTLKLYQEKEDKK